MCITARERESRSRGRDRTTPATEQRANPGIAGTPIPVLTSGVQQAARRGIEWTLTGPSHQEEYAVPRWTGLRHGVHCRTRSCHGSSNRTFQSQFGSTSIIDKPSAVDLMRAIKCS